MAGYPQRVEHFAEYVFTTLMIVVVIGVVWFAGYVLYRLYSDQR
ncbi:hypothetical protein LX83_002966 [Goodfellowiella coeruleoviolacea]|uniref:Uncharacterized protein n=1 Tax=Goodfellowiella coeruleoviolacea TaxID=334858 RepID=A0AAE3GEZ5_9PSEU|nr:hypothetical protein [Goodfellowiella coeruleoviolacea]